MLGDSPRRRQANPLTPSETFEKTFPDRYKLGAARRHIFFTVAFGVRLGLLRLIIRRCCCRRCVQHYSENGGVSMMEDGLPDFYSKRVLPDR